MSLLMEALRKAEDEKNENARETLPAGDPPERETPLADDSLLVLDIADPSESAVEPVTFDTLPQQEEPSREAAEEAQLPPRETPPPGRAPRPRDARREPPAPLEAALEEETAQSGEAENEQQMALALLQARARARKRRLLLGLLTVLALICLAALGSWYFMVIQAERGISVASSGPPPMAEEDLQRDDARAGPAVEKEKAGEAGQAAEAADSSSQGADTRTEPVAQASGARKAAAGEASAERRQGPLASAPSGNGQESPRAPGKPLVKTPPATAKAAYERAMERMAGGGSPNPAIRIRRSTRKAGMSSPVRAAWQAFQAGRYAEAERLYAAVLAEEALNRDALLGRAAVAVATGRPEEAQEFYLRLLERDPRDPLAQAGMVSLQGKRQPVEAIARVQQLIAANPGLGGLHFILGNLYAAQKRWAYAQQAYFKAHVSDPSSPDYLFNLAVSLDHLGKGKQALAFYRRALEQAGRREARFPTDAASRRAKALAAALEIRP